MFKKLISKLVILFGFKLGIYRIWSKIYRFIWERNKRLPLKSFLSLEELVAYVGSFKWRADTWRELGDAISSPEHVQWIAENDPKRFIGDCDEFAVYQANVIENSLSKFNHNFVKQFNRAFVMTIMWYQHDTDVGYAGHNVCLLSTANRKYCYMDYGFPSVEVETPAEIAEMVMKRYASNYELIAWAIIDPQSLEAIETSE